VPRVVTVRREPTGRWSVSFSCEMGEAPPKVAVRTAIGIDLGLTTFATLSDGTEVPNPRWSRSGAAQLARRQVTLARRQRRSASRERARVLVAKAHQHVQNQRKDFARKLACTLFSRYDLIAHEDLEIRRMVGGSFAKSIGDAGWDLFLRALHDKAEKAGRHAIAIDPRGTTQRCSGCGATVKKTIAERTHRCSCGVTLGRDHNAAINIRILALGQSAVEAEKFSAVETEGHSRP
jgi:putative transposase